MIINIAKFLGYTLGSLAVAWLMAYCFLNMVMWASTGMIAP